MNDNMSRLSIPVNALDHIQGLESAPVTLVEYGDYQCPHCGLAYPIIKAVQKKLGPKLRFVFRNFPLRNMHPFAEPAAQAAEAAGAQGKFWEMHDALYENQDFLDEDEIFKLAEGLSLDMKIYNKDIQDKRYKDKVKKDFMSGVKSGVNGTPSFFINGQRYDGSWDDGSLNQVLMTTGD
jgi:protein-disulfide isomerase